MHLYLLRHAEAYPTYPDDTRELTPKGIQTTRQLAAFLSSRPRAFQPEKTWYSTLTRARQTAHILLSACSPSLKIPAEEKTCLAPDDNPATYLATFSRLEHNLLIVGHNPYLEILASTLLTGNPDAAFITVKKSALLAFERLTPTSAFPAAWTLSWALTPRLFRP